MAQISKKVKSLPQEKCAQGSDLSPIFGDLGQSEKLSEIKPPLVLFKYLTAQMRPSFIRKGIENSKAYFESKSQVGSSHGLKDDSFL